MDQTRFFVVLGLKRFATVKWVYVVLMKKKQTAFFFTAVGNVCPIVSFKKQKNNNCRLKLHNIDLSYEGHCECTFHTCNHVPML